ncbi:hypothetical protein [Dendronalium sp. ChiSLP03b]|uniref:hypothetical protein n=1 Tax=Dendronalium sp. ChiSLP03b TaxID=3075381 RepID=UPI002AD2E1A5|nr:hypothetical protein [Dendronalium sp. ChiSLP03b]MDZ8206661.1 hypothetical protein [Dendronalium sp. ChiSLP03b]
MTQEPDKFVNLSVHESADASVFSSNPKQQAAGETKDLNDSVHDDENPDVPHPKPSDAENDENLVDRQVTIANLSAG